MKINLILILIGAVLASFVNLVWETLDYGFPDDLVAPSSDQEQLVIHCHLDNTTLPHGHHLCQDIGRDDVLHFLS